jgi:hypothetical protein
MIKATLRKMDHVSGPQSKFLQILFTTLMCFRGKANFRNLSRYCGLNEKTCSRWYRQDFDFVQFNRLILESVIASGNTMVAVLDCSFSKKSGKHTYGLDNFYNSQNNKAEKGLEIATLAVVDVDYNTAYNLSTAQTPKLENPDETRVDWYNKHLKENCDKLPGSIRYLVVDGYYSKTKFINAVLERDLHQIGKLRHDSHLRWLYTGPQKTRGRKKKYDGKVIFDDLNHFEYAFETDGIRIYTAVVNSVKFKRNIRVVYLVKQVGQKVRTALLFSTDTTISALDLYRFYKARFQIEFLFRDAKQFTGLCDCQSVCQESLDFHFNASMTALNLLKMEDRQGQGDAQKRVLSIASWKIRKFNEHLLLRFSYMFGLDLSSMQNTPIYHELCNYGAIAA